MREGSSPKGLRPFLMPLFTRVRGRRILRSSVSRRATSCSLWNIKDFATTLTHVPSPKEG